MSEEHYYNSPADYAPTQEPKEVSRQQIVTSWPYESVEVGSSIFDTRYFDTRYVFWHMSKICLCQRHIICHMSNVTYHLSYVKDVSKICLLTLDMWFNMVMFSSSITPKLRTTLTGVMKLPNSSMSFWMKPGFLLLLCNQINSVFEGLSFSRLEDIHRLTESDRNVDSVVCIYWS